MSSLELAGQSINLAEISKCYSSGSPDSYVNHIHQKNIRGGSRSFRQRMGMCIATSASHLLGEGRVGFKVISVLSTHSTMTLGEHNWCPVYTATVLWTQTQSHDQSHPTPTSPPSFSRPISIRAILLCWNILAKPQ